jgi:predicted enzyme related to lactoylglutathione lyase
MSETSNSTNAILQTVIIQTGQLAEMAHFYAHGLELGEAAATGGDHLGFPLPNLYFGFDQVDDVPEPSGVVSLWFEVEDIEASFKRFEGLGARVKYPPTKKPWGAVLSALYDPDGNLFGLSQRGSIPE